MTKPLRKDELDKIPKDGIDLKDFINNTNSVFYFLDYKDKWTARYKTDTSNARANKERSEKNH